MKKLIAIFLICMLTIPSISLAKTSFSLPSQVASKTKLVAAGQGEFKRFGFHVYDAKLWQSPSQKSVYALQLKYFMNIKSSQIVDASVKEMKRQGVSNTSINKWRSELKKVIPAVKKGDVITGLNMGNQSLFYLNGRYLGKVNSRQFGKDFFGIWLKPNTSDAHLRRQLLN